jgi:hypothetical protein
MSARSSASGLCFIDCAPARPETSSRISRTLLTFDAAARALRTSALRAAIDAAFGAPTALVASSSSVPTMTGIAVRSLRKCRAATDLAILSLYLTACIQRFGVYATDEITLTQTPDAYDTHLGVPAVG